MNTDLNDLAFIQRPKPAPANTWDQQNHAWIYARLHEADDERDAAYKAAINDLENGVPLAHVVNYLRRKYAQIHQSIYR